MKNNKNPKQKGKRKSQKIKNPPAFSLEKPKYDLSYERCSYRPLPLPPGFRHDTELTDYAFSHLYISYSMDGVLIYLTCPHCNTLYNELEIQVQDPVSDTDFFGIVAGVCKSCGESEELLSRLLYTNSPLRPFPVKCTCRGTKGFLFVHAKCATDGFFEEETIMGRCLECRRINVVLKGD